MKIKNNQWLEFIQRDRDTAYKIVISVISGFPQILIFRASKEIISHLAVVVFGDLLLLLPLIRKIFQLETHDSAKNNGKIILIRLDGYRTFFRVFPFFYSCLFKSIWYILRELQGSFLLKIKMFIYGSYYDIICKIMFNYQKKIHIWQENGAAEKDGLVVEICRGHGKAGLDRVVSERKGGVEWNRMDMTKK